MGKAISRIKKIVSAIIPALAAPASYSQAGEDAVIRFLFADYGKKNISYLDLGTNIPDLTNNTFLFYKKGGTGVCVEADSNLIDKIKRRRPKDKVIHAGVAVSDQKEATFYIFNVPAINTFDEEEAKIREASGIYKIVEKAVVPLVHINELIGKNFDTYPDLLSIDIEGLDLLVLQSWDHIKYPIPVICVETCQYSENHVRPKDNSISKYLSSVDYELYADTYINSIFVNKKWFYNKK